MVSVTRLTIEVPTVVDEDELTPAETGVLNLLAEGRCTPGYIAEELAVESDTAGARLTDLCEQGLVGKVYRGLYELQICGASEDPANRSTETVLVDVPHEDGEFTPTERGILNLLGEGRATPAYLAQEIDVTQAWAKARLSDLERLGLVGRVHRGLYELTE